MPMEHLPAFWSVSYTHLDVYKRQPDAQIDDRSSGNLFYVSNMLAPIYPMYVRDADEMCIRDRERRACVCRELSKFFEEIKRGTLAELQQYYDQHPPKGEIVVVVEGR